MDNDSCWDEFPIFGDRAALTQTDAHLTPLPENGLGGLIAWTAGPKVSAGCREFAQLPVRRMSIERADGTDVRWVEARDEEAQAAVDADINEFLRDAGIPPRPGGCEWYLRTREPFGDVLAQVITSVYEEATSKVDGSPSFIYARLRLHFPAPTTN